MKYLSTGEISEKWNISPRRIARLAAEGRIDGAVRFGKSWMIPETAEKPRDKRKASDTPATEDDKYCFPYILFNVHSEEQVLNEFTPDEKLLYEACMKSERCEFEECLAITDTLIKSSNRYIRIGALYLKSYCYIEVHRFDMVEKSMIQYKLELNKYQDWPYEILIQYYEFESLFKGLNFVNSKIDITPVTCSNTKCFPYLCVANVLKTAFNTNPDNYCASALNSHELECSIMENQGYKFTAMLMHYYLAGIYTFIENHEFAEYHIVASVRLSLETKSYFTLASLIGFSPVYEPILRMHFPDDKIDMLKAIGKNCVATHSEFIKEKGGTSFFFNMTENDLILLNYAIQGLSIKRIAELKNISETTAKRELSDLYKKVGVSRKQELAEKCRALLTDLFEQ